MFFFFILLIFLMGFSVFRVFRNIFFGTDTNVNKNNNKRNQSDRYDYSQNTSSNNKQPSSSSRKKIFGKDEGEYVDYEEVK